MPLGTVVRSIQQFSSIGGGPVTISPVNVDKTVIIYGGARLGPSTLAAYASLTNSTTVTVSTDGAPSNIYVGEVLEYY